MSLNILKGNFAKNLIDGVLLYGADQLGEAINLAFYKTTVGNMKKYGKPVVEGAVGLVVPMIPMVQGSEYLERFSYMAVADAVRDGLYKTINKPAFCYASSPTAISCYDFTFSNSADLKVAIDGTALSSTAYTVTGSGSSFTITLSTALASGQHDLLVADNKKSFAGKIKV